MSFPTIDALPTAPSRSQAPATFSNDADAFVAALALFRTQLNAAGVYVESLESGTLSALLAAIDAAGSGANEIPYYTGANAVALATLTAFGRTLIALADAAALRTAAGLVIGTDVQAYSAVLAAIAAGTTSSSLKPTESIIVACSDESTALTTGTAKVTFRMPYAFTVTEVRASVNTAPTGSTILVDINESGTTILSTKLMIDASETTSTTAATAAVISDSSLADAAEMTVDIDQVGSSIAGKGLKVVLIGHRT